MMEVSIPETGVKIKSVELVFILGSMVVDTRASGLTTIWKVWAFTFGTTVVCTRGSIKTTKSTVTASTHGLTVAVMRVIGIGVSSTVSGLTLYRKMKRSKLVYGRTVSVSNGSTKLK